MWQAISFELEQVDMAQARPGGCGQGAINREKN